MERELWKIISQNISRLDRRFDQGRCTHSVGRIVRVYLWAVLHDRPVYWACDARNWAGVKPPAALPHQSCMSRRINGDPRFQQMLDALMQALASEPSSAWVRYLDGKPLPVSKHSRDAQATFGRGAGGKDRGYKLHAIYGENNRPITWTVTPLNQNEPRTASAMIGPSLTPGYLLADANYDANHLYEHAGRHEVKLLTPRRYRHAKALGHHRHSADRIDALRRLDGPCEFTRELLKQRRRVETRFAHLTNFGGGLTHLPPWARGLTRVRFWVAGKIIIRLARDHHQKQTAA